MTPATTNLLVVEEIKDFIETAGEAKVAALELTNRNTNILFYSAHLKTIITFAALIASTVEYVEKGVSRSSEYFEQYSNIHEDVPSYVDITDLEYLTETLANKFDVITKAYFHEVPKSTRIFFKVIQNNIKNLKYYLWKK